LPPRVLRLSRGASQRFLKEMGATSVQQKFPRIVDERRRELLRALVSPSE
jgi:hypothetical protein